MAAGAAWMVDEEALLSCVLCKQEIDDPLLLPCLHSACRKCVGEAADASASKKSSSCCGHLCGDTITKLKPNLHLSAKLAATVQKEVKLICHFCLDNGDGEISSEYRCRNCQQLLCGVCMSQHGKFFKDHSVVTIETFRNEGGKEWVCPKIMLCPQHKQEISCFCTKCSSVQCKDCAAACAQAGHSAWFLEIYTKGVKVQIETELNKVTEKYATILTKISTEMRLIDDLELTRHKLVEKLEGNKKVLLDVVTATFSEAEAAVEKNVDASIAAADARLTVAKELQREIEHSASYCQSLLDSNGDVYLLDQQSHIQSRLRQLYEKSVAIETGVKQQGTLIIDSEKFDATVSELVKRFIGIPRLSSDPEITSATLQHEIPISSLLQGNKSVSETFAIRGMHWNIEAKLLRNATAEREETLLLELRCSAGSQAAPSWYCNGSLYYHRMLQSGEHALNIHRVECFTKDDDARTICQLPWSEFVNPQKGYIVDGVISFAFVLSVETPQRVRSEKSSIFDEWGLLLSRLETINLQKALMSVVAERNENPIKETSFILDAGAARVLQHLAISRTSTEPADGTATFPFVLRNVSKLSTVKIGAFHYCNRLWYGQISRKGGSFQVTLACHGGQVPKRAFPQEVIATVRIFSKNASRDVTCTCAIKVQKEGSSSEWSKLITVADLLNPENGYIRNNCSMVQVSLRVSH